MFVVIDKLVPQTARPICGLPDLKKSGEWLAQLFVNSAERVTILNDIANRAPLQYGLSRISLGGGAGVASGAGKLAG